MLLGGAFRGAARCVTRWRAPRELFVSGRAVLKSKRVCARGPRGRLRVVGWTKNRSTAQANQRVTLSFGVALLF